MDLERLENTQISQSGKLGFMPGEGFLYRLNPLTKLSLAASATVVALTSPSYRLPAILLGAVMVAVILGGVLRRVLLLMAIPAGTLGLPMFLFHGLFNQRNETPLYVLDGVPVVGQATIYQEGITFAATVFVPLVVLIVSAIAILVTTHPKKLMISLIDKGLSPRIAYVFLASLQFVPQMRNQAREILDAQQARGLDTGANIRRRFRSLVDLLAPLLIGMLISTETRSLALESRGFTRRNERVYLFEVPDRPIDRGLRWVAGIGLVAGLARQVIVWL